MTEEERLAIKLEVVGYLVDRGCNRPMSEILTDGDTTKYAKIEEHKSELVLVTDSRFSSIWLRILIHIAAGEVAALVADKPTSKKWKGKHRRYNMVSPAENLMEDYEAYVAELVWMEWNPEYTTAALADGKCFCLY